MKTRLRIMPALRLATVAALALAGQAIAAGAADQPALRLPGAGRVASVITTRVRDGFDQRIGFEGGDGRNGAEISYRSETGDLLLAFPLRLAKPSQIGIASELTVRFQGRGMQVVAPRRTKYGPLGMAIGQDCLYAWQWFERPAGGAATGTAWDTLTPPGSSALRAISLRIRLCRTATADLATLVSAAENLVIVLPQAGIVGSAAVRPSRRSRVVRASPAAPSEPRARPAVAAPAATERPAAPQTPPAASVDDRGRRPTGTSQGGSPPSSARGAPVPAGSAPGDGQRYITDPSGPGAPTAAGAAARPADRLSRDLPPEAFRPPPDTRR